MVKDRIYGISLARLIATIFIIVCHIFQFYGSIIAFWLNVGVNVFFIISGFLYGKKQYKFNNFFEWINFAFRFYLKEFIKLLLPLYLFIVIAGLLNYFNGTPIKDICKLFIFKNPNINGFGHIWFVKYTLICYLILPLYYFVPRNNNNLEMLLSVLLIILIIVLSFDSNIWLSCFMFGLLIANLKNNKLKHFVFAIIFLTFCISTCYCLMNNIDRYNINYPLNINKFSIGSFIVLLCLFYNFKPNCFLKNIFDFMDKNSYGFILIHPLFLSGILSVMRTTNSVTINILLFFTFIIAFTISFNAFTYKLIKRINNFKFLKISK